MMEIKSLKAKIFEYLPAKVNSALYIDVDIVIAKQMQSFLNEVSVQLANAKSTQKALDLGAFYDGKGHYVGWCSGCEKWHTQACFCFLGNLEENVLGPGETPFYRDIFLQTRNHLMMPNSRGTASQYYRLALLTCCLQRLHRHGADVGEYVLAHHGRQPHNDQDYFYRNIIVPSLYSSLSDKVDPTKVQSLTTKRCE